MAILYNTSDLTILENVMHSQVKESIFEKKMDSQVKENILKNLIYSQVRETILERSNGFSCKENNYIPKVPNIVRHTKARIYIIHTRWWNVLLCPARLEPLTEMTNIK